jgi:hypothetical protein
MSCVTRITTINSLHSINSMVFITAIQCVSIAVRTATLNAIQPVTGENWLAKYCHYFRFKGSNGQFCPLNMTGSTPASYSKGPGFKYLKISLNKPHMTHTSRTLVVYIFEKQLHSLISNTVSKLQQKQPLKLSAMFLI